jgi:hypothetical protein
MAARALLTLALALAAAAPGVAHARASPWSDLEAGAAWQVRNVVRIPDEGGTRFPLTDLGRGPAFAPRVQLGVALGRHDVRALWAPLRIGVTGTLSSPVRFQDRTFAAGVPTDGWYRFDSYRLTWRYAVVDRPALSLKLGATGKIRDASIRVRQAGGESVRSNVGFVPLLHAALDWRFAGPLRLLVDLDALAAPQGRAEDLGVFVGWPATEHVLLRAGWRTVEGGVAGGGGVYNFAWVHYAAAGVTFR